ncbi:MAG: TetR/AcrR family transcriptional regulator [Actinobacteria bacterium]|nr:TetR/AcrR family transcriptional regulator [Actinomycetota bacterium]
MTDRQPEDRRRGDGRQALIEALVRVAARERLTHVSYRSVAAEAGVAHGLVRHHFGTLDAMIEEAMAWAADEAVIGSGLRVDDDRLEALAADLAQLIEDDPEHAAFQFEVILEGRQREGLNKQVRANYDNYHEVVARSLERLGLPYDLDLARLVFATLNGLVVNQLIFGRPEETERSLRWLRRLLEHERTPPADDSA